MKNLKMTKNFLNKRDKMVVLNSKMNEILPELMGRNLKLVDRLQNKLKVSSFFNSLEQRNKKYFNNFIFSSNKRIKVIKTGVHMNKAIKQSSETISALCNQMNNDILIKNKDKLIKEKKLVIENTEQETHNKIEQLLNNLKNVIKKPKIIRNENDNNKIIKSYTAEDINDVKEFISEKIIKEEKNTDIKINDYLRKLNYIFKNYDYTKKANDFEKKTEDEEFLKLYFKSKKALHKLSDNYYVKKNLSLINYSKPKPFQIQDKEGTSLNKIKNFLYPTLFDKKMKEKIEKDNLNKSDSDVKTETLLLSHNESRTHNDINKNSEISYLKNNLILADDIEKIKTSGKDTLEVLTGLANQSKFLSERFEKKFRKINSLIDLNLPKPRNYELILNYSRLKEKEKFNKKFLSILPDLIKSKKKYESRNNPNKPYLNDNIRRKLTSLKHDIENKKIDKNMFDSLFGFKSGFNTTKPEVDKMIKLKKIIGAKKIFEHKASMDDIKQKKKETVFITLKKMKSLKSINLNDIRKIKSSDAKKCE